MFFLWYFFSHHFHLVFLTPKQHDVIHIQYPPPTGEEPDDTDPATWPVSLPAALSSLRLEWNAPLPPVGRASPAAAVLVVRPLPGMVPDQAPVTVTIGFDALIAYMGVASVRFLRSEAAGAHRRKTWDPAVTLRPSELAGPAPFEVVLEPPVAAERSCGTPTSRTLALALPTLATGVHITISYRIPSRNPCPGALLPPTGGMTFTAQVSAPSRGRWFGGSLAAAAAQQPLSEDRSGSGSKPSGSGSRSGTRSSESGSGSRSSESRSGSRSSESGSASSHLAATTVFRNGTATGVAVAAAGSPIASAPHGFVRTVIAIPGANRAGGAARRPAGAVVVDPDGDEPAPPVRARLPPAGAVLLRTVAEITVPLPLPVVAINMTDCFDSPLAGIVDGSLRAHVLWERKSKVAGSRSGAPGRRVASA
jgi:hypothetical protein